MKSAVKILFATLVFTLARAAEAEIDWQPPKTWVFAVGLLQWQNSSIYGSFPDDVPNRSDRQLVEAFRSAGVPAGQIIYLEDQQATKRRIEQDLLGQLARTRPGDLLIFYFAGHGARDLQSHQTYFVNYDGGERWGSLWPVKEIFDNIERHFRGDRAILMADCCHSGALFDEAQRRESKLSYACLTSSYSHNASTGNWTFTDALVKAWRGNPLVDLNSDGQIELKEMALYTELDMAFFERQKSMFIKTGSFDGAMRLADAKGQHIKGVGRRVEVEQGGTWWPAQIIELKGERSKIHYAGYGAEDDEWVTAERIRPFDFKTLAKGTRVNVLWQDKQWYPATVMAGWNGLHKVHYEGYSHQWDEWVNIQSINVAKP